MILTSDLIATLTFGQGTKIMSVRHLLIMLYLYVKFIKFASVVYVQHELRHNLTFDPIVTLTLGIGNLLLGSTHLLIMCYLSVTSR